MDVGAVRIRKQVLIKPKLSWDGGYRRAGRESVNVCGKSAEWEGHGLMGGRRGGESSTR